MGQRIQCSGDGANILPRMGARMDEDDSCVIFLPVTKDSCSFDEVDNVECHNDTTLPGRFPKQIGVVECLKCGVPGGRNGVISELSESVYYSRRDIRVEEKTDWHLLMYRLQPRQLTSHLFSAPGVGFQECRDLLRVSVRVCPCDLNRHE